MKLDRPDAPHEEPLAPDDWSMDMERDGSLFIAVVKRCHTPMCRLSVAAGDLKEANARTWLAEKARHWIYEYLNRPAPESENS